MAEMATNGTLLCIHRDPAQLSVLEESGFQLLTASTGHEGLRLFMSQAVDAIVVEYHLGLLDGACIASAIKQVRPKVPIVMVADHLELPDGALKWVDALVVKSDGPQLLWAAVHFVLNIKPSQQADETVNLRNKGPRLHETRARARRAEAIALARDDETSPFPPELWKNILNGTVQF